MARVVVSTTGYRGDVLPYVPIAAELARRGHDVTFMAPTELHPLFAGEPFRSTWQGPEFGPAQLDRLGPFVARWGTRLGGVFVPRRLLAEGAPDIPATIEAMEAVFAGADVVLTHPVNAAWSTMACERLGIPWVIGDLFPMFLPSGSNPLPGAPNLSPHLNRLLWQVARSPRLDVMSGAGPLREHRRRLGLPVDGWSFVGARTSPYLNLGLFSPRYIEPKDDWPQPYTVTGFTPWTAPADFALPEDVRSWLDDGEPPVVVTLGTSGASARPKLFAKAAHGLDKAGARGLFLVSTDANAAALRATIDPRHAVRPFLPLGSVLQHAVAIVHSGAHGTNALALHAGLPSAIRPCLIDQFFHAERQHQLGTGVQVHRDRFDTAIGQLLSNPDLARAASAFGADLRKENGPGAAADAIDTWLAAR